MGTGTGDAGAGKKEYSGRISKLQNFVLNWFGQQDVI